MKSQSPTDIFQTQPSPMPEEAPFDLSSSASTIPPAQKQKETAVSWSSHCVNKKYPCDYARDRVEKYEKYFKDGEILPIPELVEAVEPKTLSFVVTDIKTKRLAGIKKETFEDLLKAANIPGRCFCRRSFAAWDVLLPSEEVARGLAGGGIAARFFRLQPECRGGRGVRVAVCSVSVQLSGDVLAAYLGICGGVERVTRVASTRGAACGGCVFVVCLDGGGFNGVPHKVRCRERTMTVIVEGRKPLCWSCNKIGHFSKNCPQKPTITTTATTTTATATAAPSPVIAAVIPAEASEGQQGAPREGEEGWTRVAGEEGGRGAPPKKPAAADAAALLAAAAKPATTTATGARQSTAKQSFAAGDSRTTEPVDVSMSLERRRDGEDSPAREGEKGHPGEPTQAPTMPRRGGGGNNRGVASPKWTRTSTVGSSPTKNRSRPCRPSGSTVAPLSFTS